MEDKLPKRKQELLQELVCLREEAWKLYTLSQDAAKDLERASSVKEAKAFDKKYYKPFTDFKHIEVRL